MELIDRDTQRALLLELAAAFPKSLNEEEISTPCTGNSQNANIAYLHEHQLIKAKWAGKRSDGAPLMTARITAKGMDFLQNDGGLSAILGVVTVKLHEDTLMKLLTQKIEDSDLPQPEKQRYLDQLRELPAETTKHLVLKIVDVGLENWHKALPLLQNILNS